MACIGPFSAPVAAHSKMQNECISQSATEAEYVEITYAAKMAVRFGRFMTQLGYPQSGPITIYEDCKSAVAMVKTEDINKKSQHIQVRFNYSKILQKENIINDTFINREFQRADFFAGRELPPCQFIRQRAFVMLGTVPPLDSRKWSDMTLNAMCEVCDSNCANNELKLIYTIS